MTINLKNLCVALVFVILAPFQASADEVTDVVNDVAAKLVQQLPMDKKIALKSLSPVETGLPEDFLRKLTSDLEAALLTASDFEINLANRATMEDVWQEAVEFNNADFDELFKSANADVMLMMSPRAISAGVEIAITAYSLTGDNVGKTLASSGSVLLPIDLQANLGVDVNDLNQQMSQVLAEIEKVGQTGGLISNPSAYAEFYHNASAHLKSGEDELAIANLEELLKVGGIKFVDPVEQLVMVLRKKYGFERAEKYFGKRVLPLLDEDLSYFARSLFLEEAELEEFALDIRNGSNSFTPSFEQFWLLANGGIKIKNSPEVDYAFALAVQKIFFDYQNGNYSNYYIDKSLASERGLQIERFYRAVVQYCDTYNFCAEVE